MNDFEQNQAVKIRRLAVGFELTGNYILLDDLYKLLRHMRRVDNRRIESATLKEAEPLNNEYL